MPFVDVTGVGLTATFANGRPLCPLPRQRRPCEKRWGIRNAPRPSLTPNKGKHFERALVAYLQGVALDIAEERHDQNFTSTSPATALTASHGRRLTATLFGLIVRRADGCTLWRAIQLAEVRSAAPDFCSSQRQQPQ